MPEPIGKTSFPMVEIAMHAAASMNLMVLLESVLADATTDSPPGRPCGGSVTFHF
jgi:hypothetical protein